ncbi:MAG: FeoB-associated Cys-rich membrane protein [Lachnospiraceae bacterium]|nr:FeoB-associated Cys-rich membrane protein [Lachnospiraceae bacterium]
MNEATFLVVVILWFTVLGAVMGIIKSIKKGKSISCGADCAHCAMECHHRATEEAENKTEERNEE